MDSFYPFLGILTLLISINPSLQETEPEDKNKEIYIEQQRELYKCYGPGINNGGYGKMPWDSIKGLVNPECPMEMIREENEKNGIKNPEGSDDSNRKITYYGKRPINSVLAEICFGPRIAVPSNYQAPWETLEPGVVYDPGCPLVAVQSQEAKNQIKENIIKSNEEKLKKNGQTNGESNEPVSKNNSCNGILNNSQPYIQYSCA